MQQRLLTPPRLLDASLGAAFVVLNSVAYVCSYYFLVSKEDALHIRNMNFLLILYGYLQSLIGFSAGIWLARITQCLNHSLGGGHDSNNNPATTIILDEEMMLIEHSNTCHHRHCDDNNNYNNNHSDNNKNNTNAAL